MELPFLFEAHWRAIASDKGVIKLEPAWDQYLAMEQAGQLHVMTVRDGSALVGYFFAKVCPHLHYASSLTAWSDIFFILPQFMKGLAGGVRLRRLIREVEKMLGALGVQKVYIVSKKAHDLSRLLDREGYRFVELVHTKLL